MVLLGAIACDKDLPILYKRILLINSLLTVLFSAAFFLEKAIPRNNVFGVLDASAFMFLAIQAWLFLLVMFFKFPEKPAKYRLLGAASIWALVWLAVAVNKLIALYGLSLPFFTYSFNTILMSAGDALMGLGLLFALLYELARPAPEDHAIDSLANKLGASIRPFVPSEILEHLNKASFSDLKLGDHIKKDMTIFFSDIRSFTALSESLTPEESFSFVNSYLSRVVPLIDEYGGFIDKYMGDGIMALFANDDGADAAVGSAVAIQTKMVEYNQHRAKVNYKAISMGIGIHTGTLMLGVVGVPGRMEGTVISDAVNLSSRLQSIAKAFNIPLVISERTFMQLKDPGKYKYRFIGKVKVKGKDAPVSVFEIFDGLPEEVFERKMRSNTFFEQGMMAYYQKDYSQAVFYFNRALEIIPEDGASRFYLETCLRKTMASKVAPAI